MNPAGRPERTAQRTPGTLYVVATPIGNLADITRRAVDVLTTVDAIAAEDTRHSAKLLRHLSIRTPMFSLHQFNENQQANTVLERLRRGENIALISDAGTPLISDPGYQVVTRARAAGITVVPVPGPCSVTAALPVSGLPTSRFVFEGFLPGKRSARRERLQSLALEPGTLIFFEAPHRIKACLEDMLEVFGGERTAVLARELTKSFESIHGDTLSNLLQWLGQDPDRRRGEFVVLVQGAPRRKEEAVDAAAERVLSILARDLPVKQAAALAAEITGAGKNTLYRHALEGKRRTPDE